MRNIAVIGAGQIGSRHIQALGQLSQDCNLYILDGHPAALATTKERVAEAQPNPNIAHHYLSSAEALPATLDLAVIATSAEHRLAALKDLLAQAQVEQLILEKVLFQQLEHYQVAAELLQANQVQAWVNCPRRMMPSLAALTQSLQGDIHYQVVGANWGMGCNAIHFIDHCAQLVGATSYELDTSGLEPRIYQAKRPGCIEFAGTLRGRFKECGSQFQLSCDIDEGKVSYQTEISSAATQVAFATPGGEATITNRADASSQTQRFSMPFQSELTQLVAGSLFDTGTCELPSFQESAQLHLPFISELLEFTGNIGGHSSTTLSIT